VLPVLNVHMHMNLSFIMHNGLGDLRQWLATYSALVAQRGVPFEKDVLLEALVKQEVELGIFRAKPEPRIPLPATGDDTPDQPAPVLNSTELQRTIDQLTEQLSQPSPPSVKAPDMRKLKRERNLLLFQLHHTQPLRLSQLTKVPMPDNRGGNAVTHLVDSPFGIFGRRDFTARSYVGHVFLLRPHGTQITLLPQVKSDTVLDLACTDREVGIGTQTDGFFLLDGATLTVQQYLPDNSPMPSKQVHFVCAKDKVFALGIRDKMDFNTHVYLLNTETRLLSDSGQQIHLAAYEHLTANPTGDPPVLKQDGYRHPKLIDGRLITVQESSLTALVRDIIVFRERSGPLLRYHGFELNDVNDFTLWQGYLILLTDNGLYISRPGTNVIHCILCEPNLFLLSCCLVDDRLYLGTNFGLYVLDIAIFKACADQQEIQ